MEIEEQWKDICGFDQYMVSNLGEVYSKYSKKNMTKSIRSGYYRIGLTKNGKAYTKSVHRLVAEAYIPNPDNLSIVNHIDENKLNSHISNLEWCTAKENALHSLNRQAKIHHNTIVTKSCLNGETVTYNSITEASSATGIPMYTITRYCKKEKDGWRYVTDQCPDGMKINGYENYIVTVDGKIYNIKYKKFKKTSYNLEGYVIVTLENNKQFRVHRLVAEAYIPNNNNLPCVNHKDSNRANNNVSNLEWVTHSENSYHMYNSGNRKVTAVIQLTIDNKIVKQFNSIKQASQETNIGSSFISRVCRGAGKTAKGYKWKYVE